jgi:AcrR family transcriptional regulator
MRRDAQDNVAKLTAAALEVFAEQGLSAPLGEIARRAGVSPGTLYHRFGSREALIDAVLPALLSDRLAAAERSAYELADPGERFRFYVGELLSLQAGCPALNDVLTRRYASSDGASALCQQALSVVSSLIADGKRDGSLRPDLEASDVVLLLATGSSAAGTSVGWQRLLDLFFDGVRVR